MANVIWLFSIFLCDVEIGRCVKITMEIYYVGEEVKECKPSGWYILERTYRRS